MRFKKCELEDLLVVRVRGIQNWDERYSKDYAYFMVAGERIINHSDGMSLSLFDENLRGISRDLFIDAIYESEATDLDVYLEEKYLNVIASRKPAVTKKIEMELTDREIKLIGSWLGATGIDETELIIEETDNGNLRGLEYEVDRALMKLYDILTDEVEDFNLD